MLHVHSWGPPQAPVVLAVHGVTGHGGRWRELAQTELAGARVLAPDLRGHGRSPAEPPWSLERHAADLLDVLEAEKVAQAVVLGHSFGGAVALHLARAAPDRVRALVLLDPAIGIDVDDALEAAQDSCTPTTWAQPGDATESKAGDWPGVARTLVEEEVAAHLARRADGRWAWRTCTPAVVSAWGEMAREPVLPPLGLRTLVVPAGQVQPPFLSVPFAAALAAQEGVSVHPVDCGHMVGHLEPAAVGALVRGLLGS
ncbi:MAG: alpha/beta hydrolase [Mycobacteriaceae bacterium]